MFECPSAYSPIKPVGKVLPRHRLSRPAADRTGHGAGQAGGRAAGRQVPAQMALPSSSVWGPGRRPDLPGSIARPRKRGKATQEINSSAPAPPLLPAPAPCPCRQGAYGIVASANDQRTNQKVAIKKIGESGACGEGLRRQPHTTNAAPAGGEEDSGGEREGAQGGRDMGAQGTSGNFKRKRGTLPGRCSAAGGGCCT